MVLFIIHVVVMEEFWKLQYKVVENDHWTSTVTTFSVNRCRCSLLEQRISHLVHEAPMPQHFVSVHKCIMVTNSEHSLRFGIIKTTEFT
jgi:hypothetical protein